MVPGNLLLLLSKVGPPDKVRDERDQAVDQCDQSGYAAHDYEHLTKSEASTGEVIV